MLLHAVVILFTLLPQPVRLSRYDTPTDKYVKQYPDGKRHYACRRKLVARWGRRAWLHALDRGVAARPQDLPCGARLMLCVPKTGRCARVVVVDRGPFGQLAVDPEIKRRRRRHGQLIWRSKLRLSPGWRWKGDIDVRAPAAAVLGFTGRVWGLMYRDHSPRGYKPPRS